MARPELNAALEMTQPTSLPAVPVSSGGLRIKLAIILTYMLFGALLNSVGAVNLLVVQTLGVPRAEAALLDAWKDLPIAVTSFLVASLLPRLGLKKSMLLALAAVGVTIGSVVTEGARFDGVAAANPAQPLHLLYDNGEHRVTTLWELQPPDLANLDEAVISQKEGPIVQGARAPLDRTGFVWRLEGGLMGTTLPTGETTSGAGINMGLGYFPIHWLGFLLHCQFGGASPDGRDVLDTHLGLEANAFPCAVGRLHIGGYGQIGHAWLEADAPDGSGAAITRDAWSAGVGGLLELALTTRLALVGRIGETFDAAIDGKTPHNLVGMLGFSVY